MLDDIHRTTRYAPQQSVQTGRQFAQVEGFEQVVVGPGLQAIDPVGDRIAGGEHQHGQGHALLAQAAQQFEAIFVGRPRSRIITSNCAA